MASSKNEPNKTLSLIFNGSLFDEQQAYQMLLRRYQDEETGKKTLERARKGGMVPKADALSEWINDLVKDQPKLSAHRLEQLVKQEEGHGLIYAVTDEVIEFYDQDGKIKEAKLAGLKDRLSRAKNNRAKRGSRG